MTKKFDFILYGATGFTGKQAAIYLDQAAQEQPFQWAIAGRNEDKLQALKETLKSPVDIFIADSNNQEAVNQFVSQAHIVLTTAGPFSKYGEPLVKACVHFKTHYLDITGETPYVKRLIDHYHEEAMEKGVKIIPFCGFDSVPSDLGIYFLSRETKRHHQTTLRSAKGFFSVNGGINGGTVASALSLMKGGEREQLKNPDLLTPENSSHMGKSDPQFMRFDTDLQLWTAPFFMAPVNTRVVRRSAALLRKTERHYGEQFTYDEYMYFNEFVPIKTAMMSATLGLMQGAATFPKLLEKIQPFLPQPGTGPSEVQRKKGFFKTWVFGKTIQGKTVKGYVFGKGDPGNDITVKILCESAFALRFDTLPTHFSGGVLTPATALGDALIERLENEGLVFDWKS